MAYPLLINEPPLQVLPTLALKLGLNEAIILQQIHYWLNPKFNKNHFDGRLWVYNTYEQWQQQFPFWGEKTIRRAIANLEEAKVLSSFVTRDFKKIKYYSIDYRQLEKLSSQEEKHKEFLDNFPSGQNDRIDLPKRADRGGQNDQIDPVNLTTFYITENTQENTLHHYSDLPKRKEEVEKEDEDKKEITFRKMLQIWNESVQSPLNGMKISHLTPQRKERLSQVFSLFMGRQMDTWQTYCHQIVGCRFLMGENSSGFKVSLDWAITLENVHKVMEGFFYDKKISCFSQPVVTKTSDSDYLQKIKEKTKHHPHQEAWIVISRYLVAKVGQSLYEAWFATAEVTNLSKDNLCLQTETAFFKDYISAHFHHDFLKVVQKVYPNILTIHYTTKN